MSCAWGKGKGRALGPQFQVDIIHGGSGTVFDRQGQVEPLAAQVEIGVAPAMQVGGAAQGLTWAATLRRCIYFSKPRKRLSYCY
jgi:hypothetical protein